MSQRTKKTELKSLNESEMRAVQGGNAFGDWCRAKAASIGKAFLDGYRGEPYSP